MTLEELARTDATARELAEAVVEEIRKPLVKLIQRVIEAKLLSVASAGLHDKEKLDQ